MEIAKEKTVAFTGNRLLTTSDNRHDANLENVIRTELSFCLEECYQEGKNVYICGMAIGWDMLCAEEVLKLKTKYPDIVLIAAIPFMGHELMYSPGISNATKESTRLLTIESLSPIGVITKMPTTNATTG